MRTRTTTRATWAQYQDGAESGRRDRANCLTVADVAWYQRIAFDAMNDDPRRSWYFRGYLDGIAGAV